MHEQQRSEYGGEHQEREKYFKVEDEQNRYLQDTKNEGKNSSCLFGGENPSCLNACAGCGRNIQVNDKR